MHSALPISEGAAVPYDPADPSRAFHTALDALTPTPTPAQILTPTLTQSLTLTLTLTLRLTREHGARSVTMLQRSAGLVVSEESVLSHGLGALYSEAHKPTPNRTT